MQRKFTIYNLQFKIYNLIRQHNAFCFISDSHNLIKKFN